jgi:hypothetical protein
MTTSCDCPGKNCKKQICTGDAPPIYPDLPTAHSESPSSPDPEVEEVIVEPDVSNLSETVEPDAANLGQAALTGSQKSDVNAAAGSQGNASSQSEPELIIIDDDDDDNSQTRLPPRKRRGLFGPSAASFAVRELAKVFRPDEATRTPQVEQREIFLKSPTTDPGAGISLLADAALIETREHFCQQKEFVAESLREARETWHFLSDLLALKMSKINFGSEELDEMVNALRALASLNRAFRHANAELGYLIEMK